MNKEQLLQAAFDAVVDSDEDKALEVIANAEEIGFSLVDLLKDGFSSGMRELGDRFSSGEVFLPELMMASEVMKTISSTIEEKLPASSDQKKGVMVIATVAGDVHDIGKGIVASLVKTAGVTVYDLGREVPAEVFIAKAKEYDADFIGSSALLTTTMIEQRRIEELLTEEGIRDNYITMIGGAPITQKWADKIGADSYCEDATESVTYVNKILESRKTK